MLAYNDHSSCWKSVVLLVNLNMVITFDRMSCVLGFTVSSGKLTSTMIDFSLDKMAHRTQCLPPLLQGIRIMSCRSNFFSFIFSTSTFSNSSHFGTSALHCPGEHSDLIKWRCESITKLGIHFSSLVSPLQSTL